MKIYTDGPCALFLPAGDVSANLRSEYLKELEMVDGMSYEEWEALSKSKNEDLDPKEGDSENEQNRKESAKLTRSPDRFLFSKTYRLDGELSTKRLV